MRFNPKYLFSMIKGRQKKKNSVGHRQYSYMDYPLFARKSGLSVVLFLKNLNQTLFKRGIHTMTILRKSWTVLI